MITFVVQGPIHHKSDFMNEEFSVQLCINSLRKFYEDCEIILSYSTGDIEGITGYDKLFHVTEDMLEYHDNVNFQILTSRAVKYASNDIVCKLRSDMIAKSNNLTKYIDHLYDSTKMPERLSEYKMFDSYVFISNWSADKLLFYHPSDFFFFGIKKDIENIFDIPQRLDKKWIVGSEQYIALRCLEKYGYKKYIDYNWLEKHGNRDTHIGKNIPPKYFYIDNWWKLFYNNYYVLDLGECSGLVSLKYTLRIGEYPDLINHNDWIHGYREYIGA